MKKMSITVSKMGKPVIASVQNIAIANGVGLVASSDLDVAAAGTKFGTTAVNVRVFCMGNGSCSFKISGQEKST